MALIFVHLLYSCRCCSPSLGKLCPAPSCCQSGSLNLWDWGPGLQRDLTPDSLTVSPRLSSVLSLRLSFPLLKLPGWPGQLQKFPFALTGLCWLGFGEGPTTLQNRLTPLGPRTQWAFGLYCTLSLAATQGALGDYSHVTERESKAWKGDSTCPAVAAGSGVPRLCLHLKHLVPHMLRGSPVGSWREALHALLSCLLALPLVQDCPVLSE